MHRSKCAHDKRHSVGGAFALALSHTGNSIMQYMLMLYVQESGWAAMTPAQQQEGMAAYMAFNKALQNAGAQVERATSHFPRGIADEI